MINNEHQDLLDRYIRHELTADEYRDVENLMKNDPEFVRQASLMEHIVNATDRVNEQKAFAEMLSQIPRQKSSHRRIFITLSVAAAVILSLLYIGLSPQYTSHQLFEAYYMPLELEDTPSRGDEELTSKQRSDILGAIADIEAGAIQIAINKLSYISQHDPIYYADARWYLALLYLRQDQRTAARQQLESLKTDNIYCDQATELLLKLNKKKWF